MKNKLCCFVILFSFLIYHTGQAQNSESETVMESVNKFVASFNNFDWPTFQGFFTEDATIFHPFWENAKRVQGKENIDDVWREIFPEFMDSENTLSLQISPDDLNIQIYDNTAIITFHLGPNTDSIGRRTLVMVKENGKWKIAHLHASNLKKD